MSFWFVVLRDDSGRRKSGCGAGKSGNLRKS